jgi:hypothetical protein
MEQIENNNIFWVQTFSPQTWLDNMRSPGYWCDDVFLQLAANIFNTNVILIPLSPSSAHHADVRSVHGGSGDPLYMLYLKNGEQLGITSLLNLIQKLYITWFLHTLNGAQRI